MTFDFQVTGKVFEWRGPSPFYFVEINSKISAEIQSESKQFSYGWGVIPVTAKIGNTDFTTAIIPKDGKYLFPLKDSVRSKENLKIDSRVSIQFNLGKNK